MKYKTLKASVMVRAIVTFFFASLIRTKSISIISIKKIMNNKVGTVFVEHSHVSANLLPYSLKTTFVYSEGLEVDIIKI